MDETIWNIGENIFTGGLIVFVIKTVITIAIAYYLQILIKKSILKAFQHKSNQIAVRYITRIITAILYIIATFMILSSIKPFSGIGTALLGATSVFSVIIGLAAQESFGNFIAGFFLTISQPFSVGDLVRLPEKNMTGTVVSITFRHTVLNTVENTQIIVPNACMNNAIIENRVFGQTNFTAFISVSVGYDSDIDEVKKCITEIVMHTKGIIDTRSKEDKKAGKPPFNVNVADFLDSGIKISFPINTIDYSSNIKAASDVRCAILKEFKKRHIEIPYNKIEIVNNQTENDKM